VQESTGLAYVLFSLLKLKFLSIRGARLLRGEARVLSAGLAHLTGLEELELPSNSLTDDSMPDLSNALSKLQSLHTLTLSGNRIGKEGVKALAAGLKVLPVLQRLDLHDNPTGGRFISNS
jgi:Ran GTPase-activating protein (RanGAP) involved in mRNA processing and transport